MKDFVRIGGGLVSAFVLMKGWAWFVVPLDVPALTYWHALGLGLLANCFYRDRSEKELGELQETSVAILVTQAFVMPAFLLGLLWLTSFGMP